MMRALADAPQGLVMSGLALVGAPEIQPRKVAMRRCRFLLSEQAGRGRVRKAGSIPAPVSGVPMTVWQITDEGLAYLSMLPEERRKRAKRTKRGTLAGTRTFARHAVTVEGRRTAKLELPEDLTADEAERICETVRSRACG